MRAIIRGSLRAAMRAKALFVTLVQCAKVTLRRLSAVVSDEEYEHIDRLVRWGAAGSVAELVRLAVRNYMSRAGANKLLNLRDVPTSVARRAVEQYLKAHKGVVWPDEMAEKLGMDYRVVLNVVNQLLTENKVEYAVETEAVKV